ncbi:trypsin beta [Anopheles gambiae]|uniref:trypsin beta-like n=1 Tax=Anopheles coluzzii TaxID=1518534 RepID=UPI001AADF989|nr:trypsin beta-like [Anopheles coluzzii]XP_061514456.1 trypsin beta [Anopheles gambiae]
MKQVISLVLFGLFCGSAVLTDASDQNKPDGASQSGRIVNGKAVSIVKYKYALSLRVNGVFDCGATIITNSHSLTAAHCVYKYPSDPSRVTLYGGSTSTSSGGIEVPVVSIALHPNYNRKAFPAASDCDVAVLTVPVNSFSGRPNMAPLALQTNELPVGTECFVIGWGRTGNNQPASVNQLRYANMNIVSQSTCATMWAEYRKLCGTCKQSITSNMICAKYNNGVDTCGGDSGGALVCGSGLAGVVSFSHPNCTSAWPAGFAKITAPSIRSFIRQYAEI